VAVHLEQVVSELVRAYAVDGLHLDFVRYPSSDYDWSRAALEGFAATRGAGDLLAGPSLDPDGWGDYRRPSLDALTVRLSGWPGPARPGILVSAAVVPTRPRRCTTTTSRGRRGWRAASSTPCAR
jgi:uncharacterized lipoprotein YddW (UPF0748 family)